MAMKKYKIVIFSLFIYLTLFTANASTMTLISANVKGWAKIELVIHSKLNGPFVVQRKNGQGGYENIARIMEKRFIDNSTQKNKIYTYRVKTQKGVSNTSEISTNPKSIIMQNRKPPLWKNKTAFSTNNYFFVVFKFENGYENITEKKKTFLLKIIQKRIKEISVRNYSEVMQILNKTVTGHSLKRSKPYMEKVLVLNKNNAKKITVAYLLYGIKKSSVDKIIKAGQVLLPAIKGNTVAAQLFKDKIYEPVLRYYLSFYKNKINVKKAILQRINILRQQRGLNRVTLSSNGKKQDLQYTFTMKKSSGIAFVYENNLKRCEKLIIDEFYLARKCVFKLFNENKDFFLKRLKTLKIRIDFFVNKNNCKLKIELDRG